MSQLAPGPGEDTDLLLVGAGPAGLSLACAAADGGMSVRLHEQQSLGALQTPAEDGREIA